MKEIKDILTGGFDHLEFLDVPENEYQRKAEKHRVLFNEVIPNDKPCIEIVEENETFSFARLGKYNDHYRTKRSEKIVLCFSNRGRMD